MEKQVSDNKVFGYYEFDVASQSISLNAIKMGDTVIPFKPNDQYLHTINLSENEGEQRNEGNTSIPNVPKINENIEELRKIYRDQQQK